MWVWLSSLAVFARPRQERRKFYDDEDHSFVHSFILKVSLFANKDK